jgi:hypothetical protein
MSQTQSEHFAANVKKSSDTGLYYIVLNGKTITAGTMSGLERRFNRACDEMVTLYLVDMTTRTISPETMTVWAALNPGPGAWFTKLSDAKKAIMAEISLTCIKLTALKQAIKSMKA